MILSVEAINLPHRIAKLNTGVVVPIAKLFDSEGEQTQDPEEAEWGVCGSDTLRAWFNFRVDAFGD